LPTHRTFEDVKTSFLNTDANNRAINLELITSSAARCSVYGSLKYKLKIADQGQHRNHSANRLTALDCMVAGQSERCRTREKEETHLRRPTDCGRPATNTRVVWC